MRSPLKPFMPITALATVPLLLFTGALVHAATGPRMNEIMARNETVLADEAGEHDDWLEIYNPSPDTIDLTGWYLSDDPDNPTLWQLPSDPAVPEVHQLAPGGYLLYWLDNDPEQGARHLPFRLSGSGATLQLTPPEGGAPCDTIELPAQQPDLSFGRSSNGDGAWGFFLRPTPGAPNGPQNLPLVAGIEVSQAPGVFSEPFALTLTTETPGGVVKFTTNGKDPGLFAGRNATEPLAIDQSMNLRAAVFIGSQRITPVQTYSYLAIDAEVEAFSSNLPLLFIDSRGHPFSGDTSLSATFEPSPVTALLVDPHPDERAQAGRAPDYFGNAGMNVRGASSRAWPKQQYKFETWGEDARDQPAALLGLPADADWILAAPYFDRSLMRNHLIFRWWEALGYYSPRTRFFELFLDMDGDHRFTLSDYRGIYVLTEKIKHAPGRLDWPAWMPANEGESPAFTGSHTLEATNVNQHWVSARGIRLKYLEPREEELSEAGKQWIRQRYDEVEATVLGDDFSDPAQGYRQVIDLPSHIDYDIMRELSRNIDGASTFFSFAADGRVHMGPLWDYNQSLGLTSLFAPNPGWETAGWNVEYMTRSAHWMKWWNHLDSDPEYQQAWDDRWVTLRQGRFTRERLLGEIEATAALLQESQARNFERWDILGKPIWVTGGSTRADPGEAERDTFAKEVAYLSDWLSARLDWLDSQVASPPTFSLAPGTVPLGAPLAITDGQGFKRFSGTVHYTLDGTDPRLPGGDPNPRSARYAGPLTLDQPVHLTARMRSIFGKWSTLRRARYFPGAVAAGPDNLLLSEIHYNPPGPDDLEFIEFANPTDHPIDLTGIQLGRAVSFTFGPTFLLPGEALLVVEDAVAFHEEVEGARIAGQWAGALSNGGETLEVTDAQGRLLLTLTYDDEGDWPREADGIGSTLEWAGIDGASPNDPTAWKPSVQPLGSPGEFTPSAVSPLTYAAWSAGAFPDETQSTPASDPDGDGFTNLVEFCVATDPLNAADKPHWDIRRTDGDESLGLHLSLGTPLASQREFQMRAELSADLVSWQAVEVSPMPAEAGPGHLLALPDSEAAGFVRLRFDL